MDADEARSKVQEAVVLRPVAVERSRRGLEEVAVGAMGLPAVGTSSVDDRRGSRGLVASWDAEG